MADLVMYVGHCTCAGTLNDGSPWSGIRAALAPVKALGATPVAVKVYKCVNSDDVANALYNCKPCTYVYVTADLNGRINSVTPA